MIDFEVLAGTTLKLAVDPLGGAGVYYWPRIEARYGLGLEVLNPHVDATFRFMTCDWDGRVRMDCSSPLRDGFDDCQQGQIRCGVRGGYGP